MESTILPTAERAAPAMAHTEPFLAAWQSLESRLNGAQPRPIKALRQAAVDRFAANGFPTPRLEDWRSTDVEAIYETRFAYRNAPGTVTEAELAPFRYAGCAQLVFVDGHYVPALSRLTELPAGIQAGSLAEALAAAPERVGGQLATLARMETPAQAFVALNTAFIRDGLYVAADRGAVAETPIQALFVSTGDDDGVCFPRNLVVADEASQLTVIETYATLGRGRHFTCGVTEALVGPGAVVDHYKVQKEQRSAFHVAALYVHQDRASTFDSHSVQHGGALVRNDWVAVLAGEGVSCTLNGLYVMAGEQHVDNHMLVEHVAPNCYSFELYKGILEEASSSVFNGRIFVHKGAQKTDAVQSNKNLLLSRQALAQSNPQLEIFADDVRCTHGSTVGQLDEEAVFYLRSRGIGDEAAKSILTYAFAADIVERIKPAPVREDLEAFLFQRLPDGDIVRMAAL
ncbi:MAG: Fe-S cluster assembly protein SufD [Chloroflexi bacterium]|nr:Fe-S cluster assembly protein SufD [Chloroflexota bacterium]